MAQHKTIPNVSKAVTLLVRHQCMEHFSHRDVEIMGAPSECHDLVERSNRREERLTRRKIHALTGLPYRVFERRLCKDYGLSTGSRRWERILCRVYRRIYPF